jgi:hypothetical protein
MISVTVFKNTFDNKTHRRINYDTWQSFEEALYNMSAKSGNKGGTNSSPLISPATYIENTTRANKNVVCWSGWCAIDVDDFNFNGDLKDELHRRIGNWYYVCYSTASSRVGAPKFRIVFPLTRNVEASEIRHFWFSINSELEQLGDRQTKDLSRMYYVPAKYPSADNFIFSNAGDFLDPSVVMRKYSYAERDSKSFLDRLPDEIKKAVLEHRKQSLEKTNIVWSSYRDCPFFPKRLALEYQSIRDTGWYHKMYQIMIATSANAIKNGYPITAKQISDLCREFDIDTGNWYSSRPIEVEADRAVEYAYRNF